VRRLKFERLVKKHSFLVLLSVVLLVLSSTLQVTAGDLELPKAGNSITVMSPNGEEILEIGEQFLIKWAYSGDIGSVRIELVDGFMLGSVITSDTPCDGSYAWQVPDNPGTDFKIRIISNSDSTNDYSDNYFEISEMQMPTPATLTVIAPNGGETLNSGDQFNIQWSYTGDIESVSIELYDDKNLDSVITSNTDCDGSYLWTVPDKSGTKYRIKIESNSDTLNDVSDNFFTIETPVPPSSITVLSPNGGEEYNQGDTVDIRWNYFGDISYVSIELYDGFNLDSVISSNTDCDGQYYWDIPTGQTTKDEYSIRIKSLSDSTVNDFSDSYFSIGPQATPQPGITVIGPNGGENWKQLENREIKWSSTGVSFVNIELWIDESTKIGLIVEKTASDGSYNWDIPKGIGERSDYKILIRDFGSSIYDFSDNTFSITAGAAPQNSITVTSPNGGENWDAGSTYAITWSYTGSIANVDIELWVDTMDLNSKVDVIITNTACDGSYLWTIQSDIAAGTDYKIKIKDSISQLNDDSDNTFTISADDVPDNYITVSSPNGGEHVPKGFTYAIVWSYSGTIGLVDIDLYKSGSLLQNIVTSTDCDGSYQWDVPNDLVSDFDYKILISSQSAGLSDFSDSNFHICLGQVNPTEFMVLYPNGGNEFVQGGQVTIKWSASNDYELINIELWKNDEHELINTVPNSGNYLWTIKPDQEIGSDYKIKIISDDLTEEDFSDSTFIINKDTSEGYPTEPNNPTPTNKDIRIPISTNQISWEGGDNPTDDGGGISYTVEIADNLEFEDLTQYSNLVNKFCILTDLSLQRSTTYYWRVSATNENYGTTVGPIWQFSTEESLDDQRYIILFPSI
jgi:hypothetical protein